MIDLFAFLTDPFEEMVNPKAEYLRGMTKEEQEAYFSRIAPRLRAMTKEEIQEHERKMRHE